MTRQFSASDLESYLDEALPAAAMSEIEDALRNDKKLAEQLVGINGRRDAGVHTLGEIWRRGRLSCPAREQLGSFLLGAVSAEMEQYVRFHLEVVHCRYCNANHDDLKAQQAQSGAETETRRRRYFQSSAGYLSRD